MACVAVVSLLSVLDLQMWRSPGRLLRALRSVLLILAVFGLTPGATELVEAVEHVVHDGHLPHSAEHAATADAEEHDTSDEHGCTPTAHHCGCCLSLPATAPPGPPHFEPPPQPIAERTLRPRDEANGPRHGTPPPLRPPIA